jgi:hypothetical protein
MGHRDANTARAPKSHDRVPMQATVQPIGLPPRQLGQEAAAMGARDGLDLPAGLLRQAAGEPGTPSAAEPRCPGSKIVSRSSWRTPGPSSSIE